MGDVPLFAMAPKDFSSKLEMPAAILAGIGLILRISSPVALALSSQCLAAERIFFSYAFIHCPFGYEVFRTDNLRCF